MSSAVLDQVSVDIVGTGNKGVFRATGSTIVFDGWLRVYQEQHEDDEKNPENTKLPLLNQNDKLDQGEMKNEQHFTQPPRAIAKRAW